MGLAFIYLLRSFANGGSSLTGLEAISNGVSNFKRPEAKHARQTLVVMSSVLAFLVLGVTMLAKWTHAVPYSAGTPTVVSQEVKAVFGTSGFGHFLLPGGGVRHHAHPLHRGQHQLQRIPVPGQFRRRRPLLTTPADRRGHRLAFSTGILVLGAVAILLILVFQAQVNGLVALYAIGVFTGFTMAGAGMLKHHVTHKGPHWRRSAWINGFSGFLAFSVVLIFAVAKFREGAWVIVVLGPALYIGLLRLHHQYDERSRPARDRGGRGLRGADSSAPRRGRPGGPPRHGGGPGPAVRPQLEPRRPARRAL